jgi:uncharacterized protein (DUF1800 family)
MRLRPSLWTVAIAALAALPAASQAATLMLRASASLYQGLGPVVELRVNGSLMGTVTINSTSAAVYSFTVPELTPGAKVDIVFTNDAAGQGQDRNLFVESVSDGRTVVLASSPTAIIDRGVGARAFDGLDTLPAHSGLYWSGALRLVWPAPAIAPSPTVQAASRFLMQASFGPRPGEAELLAVSTPARWIDQQLAMPVNADFVNHMQAKYNQGADFRPGGPKYNQRWLPQRFWDTAANSPDQLRKRTAWALHQQLMVSLTSSDLYFHGRAYAQYLDTLNRHALGNYRQLLEDVALSPVMGIFLSHMRNRKEDLATGRMPDENFARELMQLFAIGLYELNPDGSLKRGGNGQPIETYNNADVMAMAKVFTGWSWGFPDSQLTEQNFRWRGPDYKLSPDPLIDLQPMKAYPGQSSTANVTLFAGKPQQVNIPGSASAQQRLKMALDALFQHPNVGPFVAHQLIQRFTSSNPSPAYVQRVAAVFANNGKGVRGDLGATVRALLLDPEASGQASQSSLGAGSAAAVNTGPAKLREPVLRIAHWMRAFQATSPSGDYQMTYELDALSQPVYYAPSVFGYFRPGYTPGGTSLARAGRVAPEFQIVNESTVASWVNRAEAMAGGGLGWNGTGADVVVNYAPLVAKLNSGNASQLVQDLNLRLFAGRMSPALQTAVAQAMGSVGGNDAATQLNRARIAVFVAMSSPEFTVQP